MTAQHSAPRAPQAQRVSPELGVWTQTVEAVTPSPLAAVPAFLRPAPHCAPVFTAAANGYGRDTDELAPSSVVAMSIDDDTEETS